MTAQQTLVLFGLALGAFLVPLACQQIHVPSAVGEIVFGMALGQVLGLHTPDQLVAIFSDVGFLLLMFTAGMELNLNSLESRGGLRLLCALGVVACSFGAGFWYWQAANGTVVGMLVIGAMSIGVAIAVLREMECVHSALGQMVLLTGAIGEIATLILLAVYNLATHLGFGYQDAIGFGKLIALFIAALIAMALLRETIRRFPRRFRELAEHEEPVEIGIRGMLALLFGFAAFARWLGVEAILAAFLAGVVISVCFRSRGVLQTKLSGASYGLFVPIFFISVGFQFDLTDLSRGGLLRIAQLAGVAILFRVLPALLFRFAGLSTRQALAAGILLCAPFTMLIAVARLASEVGSLSPGAAAALILYAALSSAAAPVAARAVLGSDQPRVAYVGDGVLP